MKLRVAVLLPFAPEFVQASPPSVLAYHRYLHAVVPASLKVAVLPAFTVTLDGCVVIVGVTTLTVSFAAFDAADCPLPLITTHRNIYPLWAAAAVKLRVAVLFPFAPEFFQVLPPSVLACHW